MSVGELGQAGRLGQVSPGRYPPRRPWVLWLLPLLLIPLALLAWWWLNPARLAQTHLVGTRGPGCLRLVLAADLSGSMSQLAEPRDRAVGQLLGWVPLNLRADDELAMVSFASDAVVEIEPTPVGQPIARKATSVLGGGTNLAPLLTSVGSLAPTRCSTALVLMGDGQFGDLPASEAEARQQLVDAGIDSLTLLVPGATDTPGNWKELYPYALPERFDGTNADATGLVFGRELAELTGQKLERTS